MVSDNIINKNIKEVNSMDKISVIVPCYNEQDSLHYFYNEILDISNKMSEQEFEFLFIDDGSTDDTLKYLKDLSDKDTRVNFISFSRNFGKEAAIYAGLENAVGDYIVLMDADLQDPPSLIPQMYETLKNEDFDCVATRRVTRKGEPLIRSLFAKCFYKIINKISRTEIVDGARDYRFMSRRMVDSILKVSEYNRFSKGIFGWVGYNTKWIEYENIERVAGKTKWSFWKLIIYSIEGIVGFSTVPLSISSFMGVILCIVALFMVVFIIIRKLLFGDPVSGWPSLACIIIFIGGIQLFCIGILGQYLAKTYLEAKKRPIYLIKEQTKKDDNIKNN